MENEKYHFFWDGPLSQWHPSIFVIDGIKFNCAEQWMMYSKAVMFGDFDSACKIMEEDSPRLQKQYGRSVKGFDVERWEEVARDLVFQGNVAKFSQNKNLKDYLLRTGDKIIVEASPYDAIWGVGYGEEDALENIDKWGRNWLGEAIMRVREHLKKEC